MQKTATQQLSVVLNQPFQKSALRRLHTCGFSITTNGHFRARVLLAGDLTEATRCMSGWRRTAGGPTSLFVLLWKMAEAAAVPPHRFFCHCCKGEVNPKLPVSPTIFVRVTICCSARVTDETFPPVKSCLFCLLAGAKRQLAC